MSDAATLAQSPARSDTLLPRVAILMAVLLWGGSFPAMKVAVAALGPWTVMWARMLLALTLLAPVAGRLWPAPLRAAFRADWRVLLPMALCLPCGYFLLESYALRYTSAAQAGVISAMVPLLVAAGARIFLGEVVAGGALAGLGLSVAGIGWLTALAGAGPQAAAPLLGNVLEMGAMACAAGSMLLLKGLSDRYGPWSLTALQVAVGAVFFAPGVAGLLAAPPWTWPPLVTLAVLFLGCGVTLGAFGLYNYGMSRMPASQASAFINLVPVAAVLLGWLLLGETLAPGQWAAAACVFGGVWLSQRGRS